MGRSKRSTKVNNQLDLMTAERILSSNKPRETKLRELSQLQNGNRKLGTLQAKAMFDNYNRRTASTFMDNIMNTIDPNTRQTLEKLKKDMSTEELKEFNNMSRDQFMDLMKSFQEAQNTLQESLPEAMKDAKEKFEENQASSSNGMRGPDITFPEEVEKKGMAGPNLDIDEEPIEEIKVEELPTLQKDEYEFLNKMINNKDVQTP
jgi:hypothetical protein